MDANAPNGFEPADPEFDVGELSLDRAGLLKAALAAGVIAGLPTAGALAATPKRGGRLRVGIIGSTADNFDPLAQRTLSDLVRNAQVFENLGDREARKRTARVAESWEPNKGGDQWQVRLRQGLEFHNGKTITAADVLASFRVQKLRGRNRTTLAPFDLERSRVVNARTVLFQLNAPYSLFEDTLLGSASIRPNGGETTYTATNIVGSGPFRITRFIPGQRVVLQRFPNYRVKGLPLLDEIELIYFSDATAKLNALLSGQVDVIDSVQPSQIPRVRRGPFKVLTAKGGVWNPLVMDVTQAPFTDSRVRLAMKLIANRPLMVRNALGGFGSPGNDIFTNSGFEDYPLPAQRVQDIDRARSLLNQAGRAGLTVTLHTGDVALGLNASALIFAQEARKAGVTINVKQYPADAYYSEPYLKESFYVSNWSTKTLDAQSLVCVEGGFLETKWKTPRFVELMQAARKTFVVKKRNEFWTEAARILHTDGGYILWGFQDSLDAASNKFAGFAVRPGRGLGGYDFRSVRRV